MTKITIHPSYSAYQTRQRQDAYIRQNYMQMTNKQMAAHLDLTPPAVKFRMESMGLNRQARRDEAWRQVLALRDQGLAPKAIAEKMGCTYDRVASLLHRAKKENLTAPPIRRRGPSQDLRDRMETSHSEHQIRLFYAAQLAGKPRHTPTRDLPSWAVKQATARDLITGDYLLDYETVITALVP